MNFWLKSEKFQIQVSNIALSIKKEQYATVLLFCSPSWTWTKDPLINSQML